MGKTLDGYRRLFESLKKGTIHPVYFLYGPEEFLRREFVKDLIGIALPEKERTFNLDVLHGDEFDEALFEDRIASFGLFMERRVVILRNFRALSLSQKDHVIESVARVPDTVSLVIESPEEKLENARLRNLKKAVDARGLSHNFLFLDDRETVERVRSKIERAGRTIAPEALVLLVELVGTSLVDLHNEVDKLILATSDGEKIDRDRVAATAGRYRTENLFLLLDRLGDRSPSELLLRVGKLIDAGEEPVFILSMLLRRVVQLLEVRAIMDERGAKASSARAIAGYMAGGGNPYFVEPLKRQASKFGQPDLELMLRNLRWADTHIKSSALPPRTLIETALVASHTRNPLERPLLQ